MKCYCIGGLGADERVFQFLKTSYDLHCIKWIQPNKNESIASYSQRISDQIHTNEPFILLGLSFGGLIACELARTLRPEKTILISSFTDRRQLPLATRIIGKMNLHRLLPRFLLKPPIFLAYWFFGVKKSKNKMLLKEIMNDTDVIFLKWAIGRIFSNETIFLPDNLVRIHGTNDRLIFIDPKEKVIKIEGGGHFMIVEQANELSDLLNNILD